MTSHGQLIAVTGGTGFIGRRIVRELLKRGHSVRLLVRDHAKLRQAFGSPLPDGLSSVQGDVCDARALGELLRGVTACVHLVGIIREVRGEGLPQTFERMHVRATQAIVDACKAAGVSRYVHMSALGVGPDGKSPYQQTKWQAELIVRRSGLDWTIFRPGLVHGADGEFVQMMNKLCGGEMPPYVFIPYFARTKIDTTVPAGAISFEPALVQPVAVEDVAEAFAEALARPQTIGEIYNLVGPEKLNWQELSEFFRDTLPGGNPRMGVWYVPGAHAAIIAQAAGKIGLGGLLPFDQGQALMATEDSIADPTKATLDLGITPRPFRATVRRYAGQVS